MKFCRLGDRMSMSPPIVIQFVFILVSAICVMLSMAMSWHWLRGGAGLASSPPGGSICAGSVGRHDVLEL